jgi:hypothetical protein
VLAASGDVIALERVGDWQMTQQEGTWSLAGESAADAATPSVIDAGKVTDLVARFANLRILGAAIATPPGEPTAVFAVTDEAGVQRLSFYRPEGAPEVIVTSDRHAGAFRVATFVAEQLLVERAGLLAAPETAPAAPDAGGPPE